MYRAICGVETLTQDLVDRGRQSDRHTDTERERKVLRVQILTRGPGRQRETVREIEIERSWAFRHSHRA